MKRIMWAMALMGALLVVGSGVAWAATVECQVGVPCLGTAEPDELIGTNTQDDMTGFADDDLLRGRRGPDLMFGDEPRAEDTTTDGDDELFGHLGEDTLVGFGGSDLLRGGGRADFINAADVDTENPGEDTVEAAGGKDEIIAQDSFFDTIDCGEKVDTVFFDEELDQVAENCEILNPPPTPGTAKAQQELASLSRR
jgi:RTX calcium-binding nonapeptide repeat (4 copies)